MEEEKTKKIEGFLQRKIFLVISLGQVMVGSFFSKYFQAMKLASRGTVVQRQKEEHGPLR